MENDPIKNRRIFDHTADTTKFKGVLIILTNQISYCKHTSFQRCTNIKNQLSRLLNLIKTASGLITVNSVSLKYFSKFSPGKISN